MKLCYFFNYYFYICKRYNALHFSMKYTSKTDSDLVRLLSENESGAFEELYVRYKDRLLRYCVLLLKDQNESSDIVQEVFIQIWESRQFLNPDLSFSSLHFTMARNRILNYFKHIDVESKVREILLAKEKYQDTPETAFLNSELQDVLLKAIENLPPQRKKIFNMSRIDGLSYKEIAFQLNISVSTVQEGISESLKSIRHYITKYSRNSLNLILFLF